MGIGITWTVIGILFCKITFAWSYPEYVVEDRCTVGNETIIYDTLEVGSAGILKATSRPPYSPNKRCRIVIKPAAAEGIVLSIRKIDLRERRKYSCMDYIKVFHSDVFTSPTTICHFKFDLAEKRTFYSNGPMTIIYHTEPEDAMGFNFEEGFTFTYTAVSLNIQTCKDDAKFLCDNRRCISKELTCDGRNNCGDRSDESPILCDADIFNYVKVTNVVYVSIFTVLILSVIVTTAVVVARRRRQKDYADSISDQDEPTTRLTPYQAVHPSGYFICQNPAGPSSLHLQQSKVVQFESGFSNPCYPTGIPQSPPPYN